jgi:hypothetical protein
MYSERKRMDKAQLLLKIAEMHFKLEETKSAANFTRGPVKDVMNVIIPIFDDQLDLLREVLTLIKE